MLLVEDEALVRTALASALSDAGFDVIEAADAATAIELFRSHPDIAAVFSDINLQGELTGYDVVRTIRRDRPDCTVIIATGDRLRMPTDFDEHVLVETKPYDPAKIVTILKLRHAENL